MTFSLAFFVAESPSDAQVADWFESTMPERVATARLARASTPYPTHLIVVDDEHPVTGASFDGCPMGDPVSIVSGTEIFAASSDVEPALSAIPNGSTMYFPLLNVDREIEADFNEWYNQIHVPMVEDAGLRRAHRYRAHTGIHKYFARYVMDAPDTLSSDAIQAVRGFDQFTGRVYDLMRIVAQVLR